MSEMIMQVARAISEADMDCDGDYRKLAVAALESMREPTVEMLAAAYRAVGVPEKPILRYAFNAMIDAALSPSPSDQASPTVHQGTPKV